MIAGTRFAQYLEVNFVQKSEIFRTSPEIADDHKWMWNRMC